LLAANRALFTVYPLKDDLKALWDYRHIGYAERFWRQWYRRAMTSGIAPLKTFARRLKTSESYFLNQVSSLRFPPKIKPPKK
jgi:transposase